MQCSMQLSCVLYLLLISLVVSVRANVQHRHGHGASQDDDEEYASRRVVARVQDGSIVYQGNDANEDLSDDEEADGEDLYSTADGDDDLDNCTQCIIREQIKRLRIEAVKAQILSKLRLERPPNVSSTSLPNNNAFNSIIEQFDMQGDAPYSQSSSQDWRQDLDEYHSTSLRVFSFAITPPSSLHVNYTNALYFNYTPEQDTSVRTAQLYVYVRPQFAMDDITTMYIRFYRLGPPTHPGGVPVKRNLRGWYREKKLHVPYSGDWYSFEIKDWLRSWIADSQSNYGIVVEAVDTYEEPQVVLTSTRTTDNTFKPFIQIRASDNGHRRQKRTTPALECHARSREERCCKYTLIVDFEEFGWDWVIAPKRYQANYCSGECPFVFLQQYPHTHLIQQANPQGSAGPCCNPVHMLPISMLYFDESMQIVYGKLPGMSVERCGCS